MINEVQKMNNIETNDFDMPDEETPRSITIDPLTKFTDDELEYFDMLMDKYSTHKNWFKFVEKFIADVDEKGWTFEEIKEYAPEYLGDDVIVEEHPEDI
jgi:hypothetical protein